MPKPIASVSTKNGSPDSSPDPDRKSVQGFALTLRRLRQAGGLTLSELAQKSGLSISTLSKIENGAMSPTYDTISALAHGLQIELAELFSESPGVPVGGRRTITRKGEGAKLATKQYEYEMLCGDIAKKHFIPLFAEIKSKSVLDFGELVSHPGEEFIFVVSGEVTLFTEHYESTVLKVGDCCYFDSTMGHAIISTSNSPAKILWVCSQVVAPLKT